WASHGRARMHFGALMASSTRQAKHAISASSLQSPPCAIASTILARKSKRRRRLAPPRSSRPQRLRSTRTSFMG
ncbi:hypothetical protein BGZ59_003766, partial [Podila verticillata]